MLVATVSAFLAMGISPELQTHGQLKLPIDRGYHFFYAGRPDHVSANPLIHLRKSVVSAVKMV